MTGFWVNTIPLRFPQKLWTFFPHCFLNDLFGFHNLPFLSVLRILAGFGEAKQKLMLELGGYCSKAKTINTVSFMCL